MVKGLPEERTIALAHYMVDSGATVRQAAARFGVSKSTVHKDITTRLKRQNAVLYAEVQAVLLRNFVKVTEPGAFLMITNSSEIIGKGFQGY